MIQREEILKLLEALGPIPVAVPHPEPKRLQVRIGQLSAGKYRTIIANGTLFAWREDSQ